MKKRKRTDIIRQGDQVVVTGKSRIPGLRRGTTGEVIYEFPKRGAHKGAIVRVRLRRQGKEHVHVLSRSMIAKAS